MKIIGDVKPSKILNINKEESYDTYENRLIYTLIQNMKFFVSVKKKTLEEINNNGGNKNTKRIDYKGESRFSGKKVNITLELNSALDTGDGKTKKKTDLDILLDRIDNIEMKILDLTNSEVYKVINKLHIALITGPIKKTNVVLKNVHFQYAMKLWTYLQENFENKTQNVSEKNDYEDEGDLKRLVDESFYLEYLLAETLDKDKEEIKNEEKEKEIQNIIISKMLERIAELNSEMTLEELKRSVGERYAVIKRRNMATIQEIQDIFDKRINKYLDKIQKD